MAFDPITAIMNVANTILGRVLPDKTQQDAAKANLLDLQLQGEIAAQVAQIQVNAAEATNPSVFVAGWRPFIGWICGVGLGVQYIIRPLFEWGSALFHHATAFPSLDLASLMTLMGGMLGLSGLRQIDKSSGTDTKLMGK